MSIKKKCVNSIHANENIKKCLVFQLTNDLGYNEQYIYPVLNNFWINRLYNFTKGWKLFYV